MRERHATGGPSDAASVRNPADEALRELGTRYNALFDRSADGILIADIETKTFQYANPALCRMLGYTEDELRTMGVLDIHPKAAVQSVVAEFEAQARGDKTLATDIPCLRKDGSIVHADINSVRITVDGRPCNMGFFRDITERKRAEEKLRESAIRYQTLVEHAPVAIFVNRAGRVVLVNAACLRLFGATAPEQLLGKSPFELFHPDCHPAMRERIRHLQDKGKVVPLIDEKIIRLDGTPVDVEVTAAAFQDQGGNAIHVVLRDITARKNAEAILVERERTSRLKADIAAAWTQNEALPAVLNQCAEAMVLHLDAAFARVWTLNREENVLELQASAGLYTHLHGPHGRVPVGQFKIGLIVEEGKPHLTNSVIGDPRVGDQEWARREGMVSFAGYPLLAGGRVLGVMAMFARRPLSAFTLDTLALVAETIATGIERKRAEVSLASSVSLLQATFESTADGLLVVDMTGQIVQFNQKFAAMWGIPADLLASHDDRRAIAFVLEQLKDPGGFVAKVNELYAQPEAVSFDVLEFKDGRVFERYSQPQKVGGKGVGRVWSFRDITARKRAEAEHEKLQAQFIQAQKMEAVGRLAGGVAHDFNNLLMGIMNYVDLCRDRVEPDHPIREWLDEIMGNAQRSADVTRQLLAFARKQTIALRVLDLNDAVAGMLKLLRRLIGEDINLAWLPGANLRPVRLDPSQVDQVLANLCVNARDAIAGVGKITVETGNITVDADYCAGHAEAIPGAYVFLAVSDDGCGMDKETLAQIFEPFFTTKGLGKGTGLGLSTVYGIVKQNSGFIDVNSEPGKGATFKIYLPQVAAEAVATTVSSKVEVPRGRGETILLVEDEKSLRVTCGMFLDALGYRVLLAETPGEALKRVDQQPGDIDLLLTDVVMPRMDGRQLAQRISAVKPGVKVLFMSGYTADVIAQRGVLERNAAFIGKPFKRDELALKVREVLDGSSNQ